MGDNDFKFMPETRFEVGVLLKQIGIVALVIVDVAPIGSAPTRFGGFRLLDPVAALFNHVNNKKNYSKFKKIASDPTSKATHYWHSKRLFWQVAN